MIIVFETKDAKRFADERNATQEEPQPLKGLLKPYK